MFIGALYKLIGYFLRSFQAVALNIGRNVVFVSGLIDSSQVTPIVRLHSHGSNADSFYQMIPQM